jgi:NADH:ubiquinone oxidoreductase subunit 6 (subunit J)
VEVCWGSGRHVIAGRRAGPQGQNWKGTTHALGLELLFTTYLLPFEVVSVCCWWRWSA